jgi:hypothetical protein
MISQIGLKSAYSQFPSSVWRPAVVRPALSTSWNGQKLSFEKERSLHQPSPQKGEKYGVGDMAPNAASIFCAKDDLQ